MRLPQHPGCHRCRHRRIFLRHRPGPRFHRSRIPTHYGHRDPGSVIGRPIRGHQRVPTGYHDTEGGCELIPDPSQRHRELKELMLRLANEQAALQPWPADLT